MSGKSRVVWLLDFTQIMKLGYPSRDEFWILNFEFLRICDMALKRLCR